LLSVTLSRTGYVPKRSKMCTAVTPESSSIPSASQSQS